MNFITLGIPQRFLYHEVHNGSQVKCLNINWFDYHEVWYTHSCPLQKELQQLWRSQLLV